MCMCVFGCNKKLTTTYNEFNICIYIYLHRGLEIDGIASPNVNHCWDNCESLRQSDSLNFLGTTNHFWSIVNHFLNGFAKKPFFLVLTPFSDRISPFSGKLYV